MPAPPADPARFARALAAIDAANAEDPTRPVIRGVARPKELAHGEMVSAWVDRLRPDAPEALRLAARAHHLRRWRIPRSTYAPGREAYLRWRRDLHTFHAAEAAAILRDAGYDADTIARVEAIIRKERLATDPDVQSLEDGLALVFLETQLDAVDATVADETKMVRILRRTLRKMTPAGRAAAREIPLSARGQALLHAALADGPDA